MLPPIPPEWLHPPSIEAATTIQRTLAASVLTEDDLGTVETVAGADTSSDRFDPTRTVHASMVALSFPGLEVLGTAAQSGSDAFPYVPGYLSFRESPFLVEAFKQLRPVPDLIFVDGQGISHPRRLGIACHLGLLLDRPTIGVAKSILVGKPAGPLGPEPGDRVPLVWKGLTIGTVLRTRRNANPLYVSPGHRISLETAVEWVLRTGRGYRLPEPTRQAHLASNVVRRAANAQRS